MNVKRKAMRLKRQYPYDPSSGITIIKENKNEMH
jgi:hypothetical protein